MFKILKQDKKSNARTGILKTPHGSVKTPCFMPCGTRGTVKTMAPDELKDLGCDILLGNTYHLFLRPGDNEIAKFGGLHEFMKWDRPILTDSGGYQVFSLNKSQDKEVQPPQGRLNLPKQLVKIKEDGVEFRSHLDGSKHFFTPEKIIDIQKNLGSDIMMVLDECAPYPCSKKYAREAMERTHNWALEALKYHKSQIPSTKTQINSKFKIQNHKDLKNPKSPNNPMLFGIIQGSTYKDLREKSAKFISSLPFDGIAIGGVSVGEGKEEMYKVLDWVMPKIIKNEKLKMKNYGVASRPIYLMGVGTPEDILEAVERGIDMFDCVLPTRLARHGAVWSYHVETRHGVSKSASNVGANGRSPKTGGKLNLLNSQYKSDSNPIMPGCQCYACRNGFSRAYIHHLLKENEVLGIRLTTLHNLHFILDLMAKIRENIGRGTFSNFKKAFLKNWKI